MPEWVVHHGDCRDVLARMEPESVDSGVMDPPYGLGFMGAEWDKFGGRGMKAEIIAAQKAAEERNEPFGRSGKAAAPAPGEKQAFKEFMAEVASAVLRVLKPGAHVLVFGGTRTYHWMVDAFEDSGFEVRDQVLWLYGQGFPKSVNISKAIDKSAGVQPIAREPADLGMANDPNWNDLKTKLIMPPPTTPEAIKWRGWGTALKPAYEPLMLARKPIDQPIHRNVVEYGTGGINIDGCAIGGDGKPLPPERYAKVNPSGRWASNIILDPEAAALLDAQTGESKDGVAVKRNGRGGRFCHSDEAKLSAPSPDQGYGGSGGSSRFYYCAKPSKAEKEAGLKAFAAASAAELTGRKEGSAGLVMEHPDGGAKANPYAGTSGAVPRKNTHACVKPIALLRYLSRLVTPPGGTIIDPFAGSGSGGIAAGLEGFNYIGIELDPEGKGYVDIARARIRHHVGESTATTRPRRRVETDPMFRGF